jgi:phosphoglycolate phosphatase-like HAD superfamily hydrolase
VSILKKHDIPATNENVSAFLDSYVHFLSLELPRRKGKLLPGVLDLLEKLKARPQLVLGLLTGNVSRGARLKLEHYGVWHFFEFGAFADDHQDRNRLGSFARARAKEKHGREFSPSQIDVIGDTPRDIACGKAIGARTIAVATGTWSREELAKYQPDFLIDDLSDVEGHTSDGNRLTIEWLNEKIRFSCRANAVQRPPQCAPARRRNRSARFTQPHRRSQQNDRQKTETVSCRSFPRRLHRQRGTRGIDRRNAEG